MSKPYTIAPDGKSITCHICDKTSYNLNDVKHHYCGHCHAFLDDLEPPPAARDAGYTQLVFKW